MPSLEQGIGSVVEGDRTFMALNVELLRRIQQTILEEPKRMRMGQWVTDINRLDPSARPACGTVCCIAGWAVILSGKSIYKGSSADEIIDIPTTAVSLLDQDEGPFFNILFYVEDWPDDFQARLHKTIPGTAAYAKIVAEYIDFYIEKHAR